MSRTKPNRVYLIRTAAGAPVVHVIARHGKGALTIAKAHGLAVKGAEAEQAADDRAPYAINFSAGK